MTFIVSILPLIIIICILLGIFAFRSNMIVWRLMNAKRAYGLLSVYIIILLVAAGVYVLGPAPNAAEQYEAIDPYNEEYVDEDIFAIIEGQKSLDLLDDYIKKQETIAYPVDELTVESVSDHYLSTYILIEQTPDLDQEIALTYYDIPTYVGNLNVNEALESMSYEVASNTLTITEPETEVTVIQTEPEFIFDQFMTSSKENWEADNIRINSDVLYVQVPTELDLNLGAYEDQVYLLP